MCQTRRFRVRWRSETAEGLCPLYDVIVDSVMLPLAFVVQHLHNGDIVA